MPATNPLFGLLFHACGGLCAALFYVPQNRTRGWSFETYWLVQAAWSWLLLPVIGAWLTIPDLGAVLAEAPGSAMVRSFALGAIYGIGGIAFGVAIRYVGYALTYSIAVGISSVLGTLLPPLLSGQLGTLLSGLGGRWVVAGVALGTVGIGLCGWSGWLKEGNLTRVAAEAGGPATNREFSIKRGLPICLLAGVLSAVFNFALAAAQPVADVAAAHGAGHYQGNVIYLFSHTGAFLTSVIYCVYLSRKHRSGGEYRVVPAAPPGTVARNYLWATLGGSLWYLQFFFYGLGHTRLGAYGFSSWALHMILLVAFSNAVGLVLLEWRGAGRPARRALALALAVLVAAVLGIAYGNYAGTAATG